MRLNMRCPLAPSTLKRKGLYNMCAPGGKNIRDHLKILLITEAKYDQIYLIELSV